MQEQKTALADLEGRDTCSVVEAASVLGIGRATAFAAARDGSLPTVRVSHRVLVPTAKLRAMLGLGSDCRCCAVGQAPGEQTQAGDRR